MWARFSKGMRNHPFQALKNQWFHTFVSYVVAYLGFIPSCFIPCFVLVLTAVVCSRLPA